MLWATSFFLIGFSTQIHPLLGPKNRVTRFWFLHSGTLVQQGPKRPLPIKILDFASQMATFGAFWALSFTVRMHVLHIKSSALDLKSAAKFTNWGLSSRSTETANDTRNSLTENMQAEHIKPLNWLKAGVAYQATTDIGVPYFGYPSAQIVDLNCAKTRLGWESFVLLLMLYRGIIRFPRKRTLWPVGRVEINSSEIPKSEIGGVWKARLNGIKVDAIKLPETEILRKRLCVKLHMSMKLFF